MSPEELIQHRRNSHTFQTRNPRACSSPLREECGLGVRKASPLSSRATQARRRGSQAERCSCGSARAARHLVGLFPATSSGGHRTNDPSRPSVGSPSGTYRSSDGSSLNGIRGFLRVALKIFWHSARTSAPGFSHRSSAFQTVVKIPPPRQVAVS